MTVAAVATPPAAPAITNPQQLAQASTGPQQVTITGSSDFSAAVLEYLGVPVTPANVTALNAWQAAEGQWHATGSWNAGANHNPLNLEGTTHGIPSTASSVQYATPTNPINVYPDWTSGIVATAQRINANPGIVAVLKASAGTAALSAAVAQSGWGTGNFAGNAGANQPNTAGGDQTATLQASIGGIPIPALPGTLLNPTGSGGALGWADSLSKILGDLTNPAFYKRVFMGAAGVALIIGGMAVFLASTKPGQDAAQALPIVAAA